MNRAEHRRRGRLRRRILVGVLGVGALGAGVAVGVLQDRAAPSAEPTPSPTPSIDVTPLRTTVFSVASTADTSRVLAIPPLLLAEPVTGGGESTALLLDSAMRAVGPAGEAPLRQHASGFGPEGLAGALRNELGLRIDTAAEITEVELAELLERLGTLDITIPVPIEEGEETVYEAGVHPMEPAELVTFLAFPFADDTIEERTKLAMLADAWLEIATAPAMRLAARDTQLASDAAEALRALATVTSIEPVPVTPLEDGIVLDTLAYRAMTPGLERIWLLGTDPEARPVIDLRGQALVEPMLLLISDGIRIERMTVEAVPGLVVETEDDELGRRIVRLLGDGEVQAPGEPLRTGLDARITFPRGA